MFYKHVLRKHVYSNTENKEAYFDTLENAEVLDDTILARIETEHAIRNLTEPLPHVKDLSKRWLIDDWALIIW